MRNLRLCVFASTMLLAASSFGQSNTQPTPPTPAQMVAGQVARLTTLLTLTTAQQTQATSIFTTSQTALTTIFTSEQAARTALQTAVKANDSAGIATAAATLGSLTTQRIQTQATADAAFYAILMADQQTKFQQLHSFGLFGGPGFGPGGHGGPGGPGHGPGGGH